LYLKRDEKGDVKLDERADIFSGVECAGNPKKLLIQKGIGYETRTTDQSNCQYNVSSSGDGTVPYASLSFPRRWKQLMDGDDTLEGPNVEIFEIKNAEHREMLSDDAVLYHVIRKCCHIPEEIKESLEEIGVDWRKGDNGPDEVGNN